MSGRHPRHRYHRLEPGSVRGSHHGAADPSPVAAAGILGADLGRVIEWELLISAIALVVVSIGAGSMVVSHANDSYFWVVTQLSGMDLRTGVELQTLGTLVQESVAACAVWIVSLFAL